MTSLTLGLPKKGLVIAHSNICILRNKIQEIDQIVQSNHIHVLAVSETRLDSSLEDAELSVQNYTDQIDSIAVKNWTGYCYDKKMLLL